VPCAKSECVYDKQSGTAIVTAGLGVALWDDSRSWFMCGRAVSIFVGGVLLGRYMYRAKVILFVGRLWFLAVACGGVLGLLDVF